MLSPDNKRVHWVLVVTRATQRGVMLAHPKKDIWASNTWEGYIDWHGTSTAITPRWMRVAESDNKAELKALGNLMEETWVAVITSRNDHGY